MGQCSITYTLIHQLSGHLSEKIGQRAGIQTYPFILTINDYSPTLVKFERSLLVLLVSITVRRSDTDEHVETFLKY